MLFPLPWTWLCPNTTYYTARSRASHTAQQHSTLHTAFAYVSTPIPHVLTNTLAIATRLDDAMSIARDEEGFMQRWRGSRGRIIGMESKHRAPDEWVVPSELSIQRRKVIRLHVGTLFEYSL